MSANNNLPEPITRLEAFLADIAGKEVELPKAVTRLEKYLASIAGSSGGEVDQTYDPTSENA